MVLNIKMKDIYQFNPYYLLWGDTSDKWTVCCIVYVYSMYSTLCTPVRIRVKTADSEQVTDMSGGGQAGLAGPHYSTAGWQEDHHGVHPVEMLARIAKFQAQPEPQYKPQYERTGRLVLCTYAGLQATGNGKLEKQAKLVSARNMICQLKKSNIGIVNEVVAAGVTVDPSNNPHRKPLVRQLGSFTKFQSAGTLSSSFVSAAATRTGQGESSDIKTDPEVERFQAYIEGKADYPSESLPGEVTRETAVPATTARIVFKRAVTPTQPNQEMGGGPKKIKK